MRVSTTPTSFSLHPTPFTLNPTPYTLHPSPYNLHLTLFTPYLTRPARVSERHSYTPTPPQEREFFIDNLLVQIH